jgi:cellulose synthase/poly-beta-1,6-N-acetylglucosamine synthase-like glycosyltransferase
MQLDPVEAIPGDDKHSTLGTATVGVVAIGRNEGERLRRCLESVQGLAQAIVYVDSGSNDGSVELGRSLASAVVELDLSIPFTAARARNQGFHKLMELQPNTEYVFFVDGDCEVVAGWLQKAVTFLVDHRDMAIVWGLRRERYPERSIYNMLCDMEWTEYPLGETKACGGDALIRADALREVNGYRPDLICGEEPEMCVRLRRAGWRIYHLDEPMTIHDAAIYRFGQWWRRMLRGGYGFAQASALHGAPPECHGVLESRRAWIWGFCIPVLTIILFILGGAWALLLLLVYPVQMVRLARLGKRSAWQNPWRAVALVLSKFPEVLGQMKYFLDRYRRVQSGLIEYK